MNCGSESYFGKKDKNQKIPFNPSSKKGEIRVQVAKMITDTYDQVWHLPTTDLKLTGKQWIEMIAQEMKAKPNYMVLSVWMLGIMGLFMPIIKELKEMVYRFDRDYYFNSSKFEKRFNSMPTEPAKAIKAIAENL